MFVSLFVLVVVLTLSVPAALIVIPLHLASPATSNHSTQQHASSSAPHFVRPAFASSSQAARMSRPEQACIFMANHVSNLDPPGLIPRIPGRTAAFAKSALFRIPIFGYCMKLGSFIPVDRSRSVTGAQESVAAARRVLASGVHITTFVEGTRSPDGRMLPFKKGPFYLAMETDAPCVPISIYGTETLMRKGSFAIKPGTVHFTFHPALHPAKFASREDLMEAVRTSIASGLPEWMRS